MWEAVLGEHHPEAFDSGEQIMKVGKFTTKYNLFNIHQINIDKNFITKQL